ncbi:ribbon-helix-helix protein, copG family protein [Streptococcus mitis]|uniref:Uncharacterized protein n=1 Tax=Streptococcus mitis TaxID=28037 RepID=A0A081PNS0_STRMT|nr:hypothetical protein [Streptococcus mitis]KEQ32343.1 ribbon-helix-helix protein, copG family protein [Streptococcus mitis]KJQ73379.1 hypothetical protein TZ91_00987 [Streptococcus mitis]QBX26572.1 hypothetical protein Javan330_0035 [Streptococcus phage Javan330]
MPRKVQTTITKDMYDHVEALKEYGGYRSISEVVNKALEKLVNEHTDNEIYKYYLQKTRSERNEVE